MNEKVTVMMLKVDLQCPCCYKKVKKILCKFPQIRDQGYDEKANTITITVVCCNPEKIRDKLCCKGAKVIKSIEIKEPPKPKDPEKPKQPEKPKVVVIEKPKEPEQPKEKPPEKPKVVVIEKPPEEAPKPQPPKEPAPAPKQPAPKPAPVCGLPPAFPRRTCCGPCSQGYGGGPCYHGFEPDPVCEFPPAFPRTCCGPCSQGYGGGPCYHGYGVPPPPQPCFDGYYGHKYGYDMHCHVTRCDYYFSEENPHACSIM